jgi:glycosyltransferase involved in cell wall biosynthesis
MSPAPVPVPALAPAPALAIVAPSFNQVSETFVADHVRELAPGATVLVCQDGADADRFGLPLLAGLDSELASGRRSRLAARLRRRGGRGPALARPDRERLAAFLRAQGVGVVLAEFGNTGATVAEVCAELGLPLFVCFRGHDATLHKRHASLERRYRRLFGQAAGIVAESRFLAGELAAIGCPEALVTVIPSGVDPGRFPPGRPEPGRILAVGRLVEMKAPHLTLAAFAEVAKAFPQAHLDLVGDGLLRGRCEAVIAEQGLGDRVTLHGYRRHDEVAALMARASMFVQHSVTDPEGRIEGFPVAIAEAMFTALPVVSTRHSGIPEHVKDGVTGLLVEEGDVAGMAAAMARLLADPAAAAAMGRAGRAHALGHLSRPASYGRLRALMGLAPPAEPAARAAGLGA